MCVLMKNRLYATVWAVFLYLDFEKRTKRRLLVLPYLLPFWTVFWTNFGHFRAVVMNTGRGLSARKTSVCLIKTLKHTL